MRWSLHIVERAVTVSRKCKGITGSQKRRNRSSKHFSRLLIREDEKLDPVIVSSRLPDNLPWPGACKNRDVSYRRRGKLISVTLRCSEGNVAISGLISSSFTFNGRVVVHDCGTVAFPDPAISVARISRLTIYHQRRRRISVS